MPIRLASFILTFLCKPGVFFLVQLLNLHSPHLFNHYYVLWSLVTLLLQEVQCGCVVILMAIYWVTEALPMGLTGLLPVILFPLFGIASIPALATNYFKVYPMHSHWHNYSLTWLLRWRPFPRNELCKIAFIIRVLLWLISQFSHLSSVFFAVFAEHPSADCGHHDDCCCHWEARPSQEGCSKGPLAHRHVTSQVRLLFLLCSNITRFVSDGKGYCGTLVGHNRHLMIIIMWSRNKRKIPWPQLDTSHPEGILGN